MAAAQRPPIPREHGAWMMLGAAMALGLVGGGWPGWRPALDLTVATFTGFCFQEALRHRTRTNAVWILGLGLPFTASLTMLLLRQPGLLELAPLALVPLLTTELLARGQRTRPERTLTGELLALPALTLPCLAAWHLRAGALPASAWITWGALLLVFTSGVVHVNLLLEGAKAKVRCPWAVADRPLARADLAFHGGLLLLGGGAAALTGSPLWLLAFLPLALRALYGLRAAGHRRISFRTVGWVESALALWFVGLYSVLR